MYWQWKPYVPVAQRRAQAARAAQRLAKQRGRALNPISIEGRKITRTFWGEAWCDSLENHSDFENRLPRGRTYVRNGSVIDLHIQGGRVEALVSGSEIYKVRVDISRLKPAHWKDLKGECSESIDSLIDLLSGRFSEGVMRRLTHPERGLFPQPKEIKMSCSCPDWAVLCKHVAAVLYGVGARLDQEPQLLFVLRGVDHAELVNQAVSDGNLDTALRGTDEALAGEDLGAMFGIELDSARATETPTKTKHTRRSKPSGDASLPAAKSRSKKKLPEVAVVVKEKAGATKPAAKRGRGVRAKSQPAAARKTAAGAELQPAAKKRESRHVQAVQG
ncbi:MAG TPA: SWIM zinc finger family protein [Pirellulales bacterium]|nr:SWIM zinc finger family protein [Pirellulales bacterium]